MTGPRLPVYLEDDALVDDRRGPYEFQSVGSLARALAVSERSLWRAIAAGAPALDVVKIGRIIRVRLRESVPNGTRSQ